MTAGDTVVSMMENLQNCCVLGSNAGSLTVKSTKEKKKKGMGSLQNFYTTSQARARSTAHRHEIFLVGYL